MRPASTRFVTILLLIGQLLIGVVPGRSLIVPLAACAEHHGTLRGVDHRHLADCQPFTCSETVLLRSMHCHDHGDLTLVSDVHTDDDFGCHVHLPLFGSDQLLALVQHAEQAPAGLPLPLGRGVLVLVERGVGLSVRLRPATRPPDLSETEQARALRVTCLLI